MKRLVCLIVLAGCSSSPTGVSATCHEQRAWPVVSATGDTTLVANRNPSVCQQTTFGTAGSP